jgi:hypothetical protein
MDSSSRLSSRSITASMVVVGQMLLRGCVFRAAASSENDKWLILDNLINVLLRDSEKRDYEPTVILDYKGIRRYLSAFWTD